MLVLRQAAIGRGEDHRWQRWDLHLRRVRELCVDIIGEPPSSDETPTRIDWSRTAELVERAATALQSLDPALSAELRALRIPPDTHA